MLWDLFLAMHRRLTFVLVALLLLGHLSAFPQKADSLLNKLNSASSIEKHEVLRQLSKEYATRDWELSLKYALSHLDLTYKLNKPEFPALLLISSAYEGYGNYDEAINYGKLALKKAQAHEEFSEAYFQMGEIYESMSEFETSLDFHFKALEIRKQLTNNTGIMNSLRAIAFIYRGMRQFEKAIEILEEGRAIARELGDQRGVSRATFNIGLMTLEMDLHAEAIPIFREAMQGMKIENDPYGFSIYYNNLANCYQRLLDNDHPDYYDSALMYGRKNLVLKHQIKDQRGIANAHNNLAATFERASEYDSSYSHSLTALQISDSLDFLPIKKNALLYLVTAEIMLGKKRVANDHFEEFVSTYEKLSDQSYSRTLSEMATKYETAKKEAENAALTLENQKRSQLNLILTIGGIFLIVLLAILLLLYQTKKLANIRLEKDKNVIESQAKKLAELNDLKSHFFANISHELRTPLTLIRNYAEDIAKLPKVPVVGQESAKQVLRNTRQLTDMVNDLLDLSKLELNKYSLTFSLVSLDTFLQRVCASFSSLAESKNIRLTLNADDQDHDVKVDTRHFERVINNLIYNAFKLTKNGGTIKVELSTNDNGVQVRVIDNGSGIPEKDLPYLFDRFYQGRSETPGLGTGLGLAIAKELIELMSGAIEVESVYGEGTTFTITLPTYESPEAAEDQLPVIEPFIPEWDQSQALEIPSDVTIMIVEDHPDIRFYLSKIMSEKYNLVLAENGREALTQLRTVRPDLILSDLMMPEMDGWELLENIKANPALARIPVILLTALNENDKKLKGLRLGVDDYILKPFESEELLIRISNIVNNLRDRITWAKEYSDDEPTIDKSDHQEMILKIREFVLEHLKDKSLNVLQVALHLGMSERQLYRKTTEAIGMQPAKLIQEVKLQFARELLVSKRATKVSQVAAEVGFDSPAHFSKLYFQRFGKKPSEYFNLSKGE